MNLKSLISYYAHAFMKSSMQASLASSNAFGCRRQIKSNAFYEIGVSKRSLQTNAEGKKSFMPML